MNQSAYYWTSWKLSEMSGGNLYSHEQNFNPGQGAVSGNGFSIRANSSTCPFGAIAGRTENGNSKAEARDVSLISCISRPV